MSVEMKKIVVFAAFLIGVSGAAMAQEAAKTAPAQEQAAVTGAIITFEESKFDFGPIRQGDKVEHTFSFKNTGTQALIVTNVYTTCGCTVSEWTKTPVLPGKTGIVKARFDSKDKMGKQNKVLTIESNAMQGNATVSILTDIKAADAVIDAAVAEPVSEPIPVIEIMAAPEKKTAITNKSKKKTSYKKKKKSRR
jgi:hypothetical protein